MTATTEAPAKAPLVRLSACDKNYGNIIAAVVGGCLLTGGYGSAIGAAIGAFIFGMTEQGIVYAGFNPDWFFTFLGVMLLLAVGVNLYIRNYASTRR